MIKLIAHTIPGHLETLVKFKDKRKKHSQPILVEKLQKSLKTNGASSPPQHFDENEKSTVKKLVQKLRQNDNATDNESVKDLVHNLTNLALAITEDRFDSTAENCSENINNNKKKLTISNSEGNNIPGRGSGSGDEFFPPGEKKYERKFHSLDKKLKRTNLMRRRESQALLEGIRKSRQSNSNILADLNEPTSQ